METPRQGLILEGAGHFSCKSSSDVLAGRNTWERSLRKYKRDINITMAKKETEKKDAAKASENGASEEQMAPAMNVLAQYIKDLSFENPHAPHSLRPRENAPEINININVNANPLSETDFEVELKLEASAGEGADTMFNVELMYGGVFRLENMPQEAVAPAILIECPRMLFPFARQIIAEATRNGGFPPLLIDPVDFAALFQQRMAEEQVKSQVSS